ncbi:MAG: DUF342 domain-containing protein, partial [Bradymonadia bacterium]
KLRLELADAGDEVWLHLEPGLGGIPSLAQIKETLSAKEVTHGIKWRVLEDFYNRLAQEEVECPTSLQIAVHTPAVPPTFERFELITPVIDDHSETESNDTDEGEGRVDFRESARIYTVEVNTVIGRVIPGVPGSIGMNVFGKPIPIPEVEVVGDTIGEGVLRDDKTLMLHSTRPGRPVLVDHVLSVLQVYEVESDVDFSTGNIRFDGHVIIKGSVLDEFEVECKSLEVIGPVGAALIFVQSDARFEGGINGNGKCRLFVGGTLEAKYLNQVSAHVGGDVNVERGITNSEIICWGGLTASRVVGGKSAARLGYTIEDLGSELGVVTVVGPGLISLPTFGVTSSDESVDDAKAGVTTSIDVPAGSDTGDVEEPSKSRDLATTVRQSLLNRFLGKHAANDDVEMTLDERIDVVNITSRMYADVVVCSVSRCKEFVEKSSGKMSITLNEESGDFEKLPFRKLKITRLKPS